MPIKPYVVGLEVAEDNTNVVKVEETASNIIGSSNSFVVQLKLFPMSTRKLSKDALAHALSIHPALDSSRESFSHLLENQEIAWSAGLANAYCNQFDNVGVVQCGKEFGFHSNVDISLHVSDLIDTFIE